MALEAIEYSDDIQNLLLSRGHDKLAHHPNKYLICDEERRSLKEVSPSTYIPIISLEELGGRSRPVAIEKLKKACKEHGFFQVANHGVSEALMGDMMEIAEEYFDMPLEDEVHLCTNDYRKRTRVCTRFCNTSNKDVHMHWRDYLRHPCYPIEYHIDSWPNNPSSYRYIAAKYATAMRGVTLKLLGGISESLGLARDYIENALGEQNQTMQINCYPPCPKPELTPLALAAHTDPNCLTLVQDNGVSGLQIMKDGTWLDIPPLHEAFFVHIGDQLQVISNGEYKSLVHRAMTNSVKRRMSIPTFYGPSLDAVIKPASSLASANVHGPLYVPFTYRRFLDHFYSIKLYTTTLQQFEVANCTK
ncbi:hypothetical protein GIB67_004242 [Kingdonia uniflora]|uniref:Fe2OG dioxygenase domain-containing protein n=1 Tax=Kingdonia uniflora TaxID=39325 RepID=A0A7J7MDR6_9MAGN|nr:hypothetical protein GIB67_003930 [Kingdonia uniflora]KAF6157304.1 hypothetical protein GIB67_004242 [Kingdonia uniflora]